MKINKKDKKHSIRKKKRAYQRFLQKIKKKTF